jgi:hypothetical protein
MVFELVCCRRLNGFRSDTSVEYQVKLSSTGHTVQGVTSTVNSLQQTYSLMVLQLPLNLGRWTWFERACAERKSRCQGLTFGILDRISGAPSGASKISTTPAVTCIDESVRHWLRDHAFGSVLPGLWACAGCREEF